MKQRWMKILLDYHDFIILFFSIVVAIFILRSEYINTVIKTLGSLEYLGVFIAGLFFSSGFTEAPAASIIFILSQNLNPFLVAILGTLGAVFMDYLMFRFCKEGFIIELKHATEYFHFHPHLNRAIHKIFHKISGLIAGIIIASPIPDEFAAVFCASVKMNTKRFIVIAAIFKFLGILAIALLANAL